MFFKETLTQEEILSLPNSKLKSRTTGEYSSSCPNCGGVDRFIFWSRDGNYWCRQCGLRGSTNGEHKPIYKTSLTSNSPEVTTWEKYHQNLLDNPAALKCWEVALGPKYEEAIYEFGLGFCENYQNLGPTFTIPLSYRGKVYSIKHRLVKPVKNKYLTEPRGSKEMLFNLDNILRYNKVIITEGEKKAIRLWLEGYPAVSGSAGAGSFSTSWDIFFVGKKVIIVPDPDEAGRGLAEKLCKRFQEVEIVILPDKVDDFINAGGDIKTYLGEPWRWI